MTDEMRLRWGERLRKLRKERDLTMREISSKAGISKAMYGFLEAGEVGASDDVRVRIATAFGVRVEDIWMYPDTTQPEQTREAS